MCAETLYPLFTCILKYGSQFLNMFYSFWCVDASFASDSELNIAIMCYLM